MSSSRQRPSVHSRLAAGLAGLALLSCGLVAASEPAVTARDDDGVGYTDTPFLPDSPWRVHDKDRPVPPVVTPGAGTQPPSDALVLFDGSDLGAWQDDGGGDAGWRLVDGAMEVNGTGGIRTRESFGDVQLHVEWASPAEVVSESQGRGNSGVFLMGRYEIQILDSFENRSYADGQAASIYGQRPPAVNACRGPGQWQSYDIVFEAPRFDGETLTRPARATVVHNGVLVHHAVEFLGPTSHQRVASYAPHEPTGPIALQDHGNPVRYRNLWVRRLGDG